MPRSLALVALASSMLLACADTGEAARVNEPEPSNPTATQSPAVPAHSSATPSPPLPAERGSLETLALRCDGTALAAAFATLDAAALAAVDDGPSARLLARWESTRTFTARGTIEPAAVDGLVAALEDVLGAAPPGWWVDQLGSAQSSPGDTGGPAGYDVGMSEHGDRRGELVAGPGTTRVRPGVEMQLFETGGKLSYDLSIARIELGPLPREPDATLELARARAGTTVYYASFSRGSGGFRFPLHAIDSDGHELWEAEVCGPDRKVLGGLGYLTVEIVVLEPAPLPGTKPGVKQPSRGVTGIAVFTAESHGVALDVFDPRSGARTLAWSSELWFAR